MSSTAGSSGATDTGGIDAGRRRTYAYAGLEQVRSVYREAPQLVEQNDGAAWMARLIAAALLDEAGQALDGVARTIDPL